VKEEDIRPQDLHEEYLRLSRKDAETFFSDTSNFQDIACPACNTKDVEETFTKDGFGYVCCSQCGTLFQSPRPTVEAFEQFYMESPSSNYWAETFFPRIAEARREHIFKPRVKRISSYCGDNNISHDTVIDVGAGYGIFLDEWRKQHPDDSIKAIEPGAKLAHECQSKNIETLEVFAEDAKDWHKTGDLITCFEVIEHVHSPIDFIRSLGLLAKHGSHILISGLGVDGYDIQVLWEQSKSISPPHHINFMSVRGFEILFERVGFVDVDVFTPGVLDVEIVAKAVNADPALEQKDRFAALLSKSNEQTKNDFQEFLQKHRMSSHIWVIARKP